MGASAALVGLVVASCCLMQFVVSSILGSLSHSWGRLPLLLATIAPDGLACVVFGLTESLAMLPAARLVAGVGGTTFAVAQATLSDVPPLDGRTRTFGMIAAALGWLVARLCLLTLVCAALILPETSDPARRPAGAAPAGGTADVRALSAPRPLFAVYLSFIAGFGIPTVVGAPLWADRFDSGERGVGLAFGLIGLVTALVQGPIGTATAGREPARVLVLGLGLVAAGMAAMPLAPPAAVLSFSLAAEVALAA